MPNHYIVTRIPFGVGSTAHWSVHEPKTLLVFVHGFSGSAETTWVQFPSLLRVEEKAKHTDVLYLGYDSLRGRAVVRARLILQFLRDFLVAPHSFVNEYIYYGNGKRKPYEYKKIIIVGHSLGGALSRRVAIDLTNARYAWRDRTQLVLFAPAHRGSSALHLAHEASGGRFARWIRSLILFRNATLQDLQPNAGFITSLASETSALIDQGHAGCLIARRVYFGEMEDIVEPADFCSDPPFVPVLKKNHMNVCKPDTASFAPFQFLTEQL